MSDHVSADFLRLDLRPDRLLDDFRRDKDAVADSSRSRTAGNMISEPLIVLIMCVPRGAFEFREPSEILPEFSNVEILVEPPLPPLFV